MQRQNFEPNVVNYSSAMSSCEWKCRELPANIATDLMRLMRHHNIELNPCLLSMRFPQGSWGVKAFTFSANTQWQHCQDNQKDSHNVAACPAASCGSSKRLTTSPLLSGSSFLSKSSR